jgi:hypothetical protein
MWFLMLTEAHNWSLVWTLSKQILDGIDGPPGVDFPQRITSSFFEQRSQKRKKHWWLDCLFVLLGSSSGQAARKTLGKTTDTHKGSKMEHSNNQKSYFDYQKLFTYSSKFQYLIFRNNVTFMMQYLLFKTKRKSYYILFIFTLTVCYYIRSYIINLRYNALY